MDEMVEKALSSKIFWIAAIILAFYLYFKIVVYSYWKKHGIPYERPIIPFGTLSSDLFTKKVSLGEELGRCYEKFKKYPFHGLYFFHKPVLMINDPDIIKYVLVQEFSNFINRTNPVDEKVDPMIGNNLFFLPAEKWRFMRNKLAPSFTQGKLKQMYPFIQEVANEMVDVINEGLEKSDIVEFKDLIARYTTDTIFSLVFGFNSHSLKNPNCEFRYYGDLSIKSNPVVSALLFFVPSILAKLKIPFAKPNVTNFFVTLFNDMLEKRKVDKTNRKDFLSMLIELTNYDQSDEKENNNDSTEAANTEGKLEIMEAAAQAFVFFIAGFETSSSIMTHNLYELAMNPDEQEKVHQEIDELFKRDGSFNYDNVLGLKYLEMSFLETMRKHASLPILNRVCTKECKLPNSDYVIPMGMPLVISLDGLHHDPDIYPDPKKFDPTRFSKDNVALRHPYTYLPFGEGWRMCIGKRFGLVMSMVALATLLSKYKFSICEKTVIPTQYSLETILHSPGHGVYLRLEKRK